MNVRLTHSLFFLLLAVAVACTTSRGSADSRSLSLEELTLTLGGTCGCDNTEPNGQCTDVHMSCARNCVDPNLSCGMSVDGTGATLTVAAGNGTGTVGTAYVLCATIAWCSNEWWFGKCVMSEIPPDYPFFCNENLGDFPKTCHWCKEGSKTYLFTEVTYCY